ncbi:MAG: hypothetical protein AAF556_12245, partial [Pseudomonadota bacterium]
GRHARRAARDWAKRQPVNDRLLNFADRATIFLSVVDSDLFQDVPQDIETHAMVETLTKRDPVAALQLVAARLEEPNAGTVWQDLAQSLAEQVRDDRQLADLAETRGLIPEYHLPPEARYSPGTKPEPRHPHRPR